MRELTFEDVDNKIESLKKELLELKKKQDTVKKDAVGVESILEYFEGAYRCIECEINDLVDLKVKMANSYERPWVYSHAQWVRDKEARDWEKVLADSIDEGETRVLTTDGDAYALPSLSSVEPNLCGNEESSFLYV